MSEIGAFYRTSFFSVRPDDSLAAVLRDWRRKAVGFRQVRHRMFCILRDELKLAYERCLQGTSLRRRLLTPIRWLLALMFEPILILPPVPGKVLDVGFGRGEFLLRAKRLGWDAHGVEVSGTSVEWGRSLGLDVKVFDGGFQSQLDYPANSFDFVLMNNVLEHVHYPLAALKECARVLKPGGTLVVMVPNFAARDIRFCGAAWQGWNLPQHLTHFEDRHVHQAMTAVGLKPFETRHKIWYNFRTDAQSLQRMNKLARERGVPYSWGQRLRNSFTVRVGKRLDFLLGRLPRREVGAGFGVYARKPAGQ